MVAKTRPHGIDLCFDFVHRQARNHLADHGFVVPYRRHVMGSVAPVVLSVTGGIERQVRCGSSDGI